MNDMAKRISQAPALARAGLALNAVLFALLALAPQAHAATYEQTGVFAGSATPLTEEEIKADEEIQLGGVGGMAVNRTGAGGVPKGTVYAATRNIGHGKTYVAMYVPKAAGGLEFRGRWEVTKAAGAYQRCGPLVEEEEGKESHCDSNPSDGLTGVDVDVDQASGNVFVKQQLVAEIAGQPAIIEYDASGSEEITRFGELVPFYKSSVAESPGKLHGGFTDGGVAVNSEGWVYVYDDDRAGEAWHRLMVFEPESPGDYAHYVYAGEVAGAPSGAPHLPTFPVADEAGNIYVAGIEEVEVEEYAHETPGPYPHPSTPSCRFEYARGGIIALTVDPETGEPFFYSYKRQAGVHWIRQLGPCEGGTFKEVGKAEFSPPRGDVYALAFDPGQRAEPSRQRGTLYAGVRDNEFSEGEVEHGPSLGYIFGAPTEEPHPPAVETQWISHVTATGALLHAQINPEGFPTHYAFQYLTAAEYEVNPEGERFSGAREAPPAGALLAAEGKSGVAVQAAIAALSPGAEYRYRAVARSECDLSQPGHVCEVPGEAQALRTFPAEPSGLPDGRVWELVSPVQKHGGQVFPAEPRVSSCSLETLGAEPLCKPGASLTAFPKQSAPDGEAIVYEGSAFSQGEGALGENEYIARRDPEGGWQTVDLSPTALSSLTFGGYRAFSPDLSHGLLIQGWQESPVLSPQAPSGYRNLYSQQSADPASPAPLLTEALLAQAPPHGTGAGFFLQYVGGSEDLSRVFLFANDALTPATADAPEAVYGAHRNNLYEWQPASGRLALVNVMPGNAESEPGASFGGTIPPNTPLEGPIGSEGLIGVHGISADGSRAFWQDEAGQLYLREDGERTRLVSESQRGAPDPSGPQPAHFLAADPDGSRALFSSSQELTDDADTGPLRQLLHVEATAGAFTLSFEGDSTGPLSHVSGPGAIQTALEALPSIGPGNVSVEGEAPILISFAGALAGNETELIEADGSALTGAISLSLISRAGADLYEWHEGALTDLTAGHGPGGFQGLVGQSEDLSRLYFVDTAVLSGEEENEAGEAAGEGAKNLYAWSRGGGIRFVAQLSQLPQIDEGDWNPLAYRRSAQASPDGRYLAFQSGMPLTGYDNTGPCRYVPQSPTKPAHYVDGPCQEVFLYDSATGGLSCPSCNRSGERPLGRSNLRTGSLVYQPRYLLDSGRLYFDSEDSLVPADTNDGVEDVYQYEPDGTGSCATAEGCVKLISAGTGAVDSNFLAVDETAKNVFFTTRDRLVAKDTDELIDLYDAREGGGFPSESETQRAECQGEACQPSPNPPAEVTPASAAFKGAGNLAEGGGSQSRCPQGKRRANNQGKARCVNKHAKRHHRRANRDRRAHR